LGATVVGATVVVVVATGRAGAFVVVVVVVVPVVVVVVVVVDGAVVVVVVDGAAAAGPVAPVVTRPTESLPWFVNQIAPSGPAARATGTEIDGSANTVTAPAGVIRLTDPPMSVNHKFPSAPTVIACGELTPDVNGVNTPAGVTRSIEGFLGDAVRATPELATHRFPSGPVTIPAG
jgi:hypothetical protein